MHVNNANIIEIYICVLQYAIGNKNTYTEFWNVEQFARV